MDETETLIKIIVSKNRELMERLARGATYDQIEKEFWCPYCKKYINGKNVFDDISQSCKTPICGFCGNILHWHYVYKNGL